MENNQEQRSNLNLSKYIKLFGLLILIASSVIIPNYILKNSENTKTSSRAASGSSLPSSQATFYASNLINLGALASTASQTTTQDTGYVTILTSNIKTPEQKDLSASVSLQCGLLTDTTVKSKNGTLDSSQSKGSISVRIKATNTATNEVKYFIPSEKAQMPDKSPYGITYCSRLQQLDAQFGGYNCTTDLTTGVVTCADPEMLRLLLQTMNANSFNFLLPNATSGVWRLEVQARAQAGVQLGGDVQLGAASAEAFIGVGSFNVRIERLIKNADLGPVDLY